MIFLLFKILLLALSYKLYLIKKEPLYSALLFSVPLSLSALIMGNPLMGIFVGSAILFALSFLCFWLLFRLPKGTPHYTVLAISTVILIFVIKTQ
jgi:hypothetical protein